MKTLKVQTKKKFKITLNEHQAKHLAIVLEQWMSYESVEVHGLAATNQSEFIQNLFIDLNTELMDFSQ